MELKTLPIDEGRFKANGKTYIIETKFSIERYTLYQQMQLEAAFGTSFNEMIQNWQKVEMYANKLRFSDIVILAYNMQRAVVKVSEREPSLLKMCALFINEENEDRRTINDDMISAKIKDWQEEGYEMGGFFTLALNTMDGFIDAWKKLTQSTTELNNIAKKQEKGS